MKRSSVWENSILENTEQYGLWTVNTEVGLNVYFLSVLTQHWQVCDSEITDHLCLVTAADQTRPSQAPKQRVLFQTSVVLKRCAHSCTSVLRSFLSFGLPSDYMDDSSTSQSSSATSYSTRPHPEKPCSM